MRIEVLTPGFNSPNGRAFLFPLVVWRSSLRERGFDITLVDAAEKLKGCDVLMVDSKFHRNRWIDDTAGIEAEFVGFRRLADRIVYCDTTDSSGWIQTELLPLVDRYWKFQLLKDRREYLRPMYAQRIYADYYHATKGVDDAKPEWSIPVADESHLAKLDVAWNSGLADYSLVGPWRMAAYMRIPFSPLLSFPAGAFISPERPRGLEVSCRFGVAYPRESVAWQRRKTQELMAARLPTDKLSRRRYWQELADSRVVVSPFGFGEITLKDFEVFLAGGMLLKPDMSHLETWPDLFRADETMGTYSWDVDDLPETLTRYLADSATRLRIAAAGQDAYFRHTAGPGAAETFADHLADLVARTGCRMNG